jgi:predicted secreted protein with PEFG-CTERM motif
LGFEVKYISDTTLDSTVVVDSDEKTLTFTVSGDTKNGQISFVLPVDLIENPNTIWIDGSMVDFETEAMSTGTKLVIPIEPHSKEIKIMGSYVIPEFGFLAMSILSVGLISVLFLTRTKYSINFRI